MLFYLSTQKRGEREQLAGVAELADARDLKSRGRNPVPVRPRSPAPYRGVEQLAARRAHNPEVGGSSPPPATTRLSLNAILVRTLFFSPGEVLAPEAASKVSTLSTNTPMSTSSELSG